MTNRVFARPLLLAAIAGLLLAGFGKAGSPLPTTITIPDMESNGCAKKVSTSLLKIGGVAEVQTNVAARTAVVKPKPQAVLSPRALWEALEKIGKDPTRLEGPSGTFTSKPQS